MKNNLRDLSPWLWLGIPAVMLATTIVAYFTSQDLMMLLIRRDDHPNGGGIAEHGTVLVLIPGIIAALTVLIRYRDQLPLWLAGWILCWALACIYFAGEEASWGQHYFSWATPEGMRGFNDQNETNLHNVSHWFDQKPRSLVELWMVFAGLVAPIFHRYRPNALWGNREWSRWFWPTRIGMPSVVAFLFCLVVAIFAKITKRVDLHQLGNNELREFYLAIFLSGYLTSIWYRLRQLNHARTSS